MTNIILDQGLAGTALSVNTERGSIPLEVPSSSNTKVQKIFEKTLENENIETSDQRMREIDQYKQIARVVMLQDKRLNTAIMMVGATYVVCIVGAILGFTVGSAFMANFMATAIGIPLIVSHPRLVYLWLQETKAQDEFDTIKNNKNELQSLCNDYETRKKQKKLQLSREVFEDATNTTGDADLGVLGIIKDYL